MIVAIIQRILGLLLLAVVALYFTASLTGRKALTIKGWHLAVPSWRLASAAGHGERSEGR